MKNVNLKQRFCSTGGVTLLLFTGVPVMFGAQSVVSLPPTVDTTPTWSEQESTNNESQVFIPATEPRRPSSEPFVFGPLTFRPHASYDVTYATGVQVSTNNQQSTFIQTISPGLSLDIGPHLTLDYTPTLLFYSNHKFRNVWDNQAASLNASTAYEDWAFQLTQAFTTDTSSLSETAAQTRTTDFNTALSAIYTINDKWSSEFGLSQDFNYVKGFEDSKAWSTMDWLNYQFWKRFSGGVGVGAGYITLANDPAANSTAPAPGDQMFETMQLKASWRATDKISLSVNGGFQNTKYDSSPGTPAVTSLSPIFGGAIQYQPFDHTQLSLSANRTISSSDYVTASQSETVTTISLSLNQRLLGKYSLNLSGTYNENEFSQSITFFNAHLNSDRTDHNYSFNASLGRTFLKRGYLDVHYTYSNNNSTQPGFAYSSSQVGMQVSYSY